MQLKRKDLGEQLRGFRSVASCCVCKAGKRVAFVTWCGRQLLQAPWTRVFAKQAPGPEFESPVPTRHGWL